MNIQPAGTLWVSYEHSLEEIQQWPGNPKKHDVDGIEASMERWGYTQPMLRDERTGRLVAGHGRLRTLLRMYDMGQPPPKFVQVRPDGSWCPPVLRGLSFENDAEAEAYLLADNQLTIAGGWDDKELAAMVQRVQAADVPVIGWDEKGLAAILAAAEAPQPAPNEGGMSQDEARTTLAYRFGVPPFSVLDARQGYWQTRKRAWTALGIDPVVGREHLRPTANASEGLPGTEYMSGRGAAAGGSSFDPVLCELAYRWFCPPGGSVLDPFAGEPTKGIVAAVLKHPYTGIELRKEQVDANNGQAWAIGVRPTWICGDSAQLDQLLPKGEQYDLCWSSPPYYDLEIYSQSEKDGSAFATYAGFMEWLTKIYKQAIKRLRANRFLGIKVGEIRDKDTGVYRNFVGDVVHMCTKLGLRYYNEAILVTPLGSLPVRASNAFKGNRKLGKAHQNVLWFYKGDPDTIAQHFPSEVEAGLLEDPGAARGDAEVPSETDPG